MTRRWLVSGAAVLALVLLAALPWGFGASERFVLPLLPLVAIYVFSVRPSDVLPASIVFAAGLLLDVLTLGPLGYWPLVYLVGHLSARLWAPAVQDGAILRWLGFGGTLAVVGIAAWTLESIYFVRLADASAHAVAALIVLALYPVLALLLAPLHPVRDGPDDLYPDTVR